MRVLIIEDDALIAMFLADTVEALGHQLVGICCSREAALELAKACPPDAALVDLRLGQQRCGARIEEVLNAQYGTTAVYVTGNPEFAYKYRGTAIGFIDKPVDGADVEAVLTFIEAVRAGKPAHPPRRIQLFEDAKEALRVNATV